MTCNCGKELTITEMFYLGEICLECEEKAFAEFIEQNGGDYNTYRHQRKKEKEDHG